MVNNVCMDEEEGQKVAHPTFQALLAALKKNPDAVGRERAWLEEQDKSFNKQVTQNWKYRGLPTDHSKLLRLAAISGATIEALSKGNSAEIRDLSTTADVGMPGKKGHTTTVNPTTDEVKQGSILPLLPWNRVELMLLPNDRPEIAELPDAPRVPLVVDWDPGVSKVVEMPNSSLGRPAKGDYLIFDPSLPADRTHIPDQLVLARTPGGAHLIRRYDAADMESKQQAVVCWCEQWYPPKNT